MKISEYNWLSHKTYSQNVKILGAGSAGIRVLDQLVFSGIEQSSLCVLDSDQSSLKQSIVEHQILLGESKGANIGSEGNTDLALQDLEKSSKSFESLLDSCDFLMICASTSGGIGFASIEWLTQLAKSKEKTVLVFGIIPFSFLNSNSNFENLQKKISPSVDGIFLFPNDNLSTANVLETGGLVEESFAQMNRLIAEEIKTIFLFIQSQDLALGNGFSDLLSLFPSEDKFALVATAIAFGENRVQKCVRSLKNQLLIQSPCSRNLTKLISITSSDFGLYEMQLLSKELEKHFPAEKNSYQLMIDKSAPSDSLRVSLVLYNQSFILGSEEKETSVISSGKEEKQKVIRKKSTEKLKKIKSNLANQFELDFLETEKGKFNEHKANLWEGQDLDIPTIYRLKICQEDDIQ